MAHCFRGAEVGFYRNRPFILTFAIAARAQARGRVRRALSERGVAEPVLAYAAQGIFTVVS